LSNPTKKIVNSSKFNILSWALFDFANTSFSIVVVTFVFAIYFKEVVCNSQPIGDFYWSLGTSISMLIVALISPILGAIADFKSQKKLFLLIFTFICIIFTGLLFFVRTDEIIKGLIFFIIANVGFEAGLVFYDAFLPEITKPSNFGRVSGYGFAFGYLGSFVTLLFTYYFISIDKITYTFLFTSIFFTIFALPIFLFLKENKNIDTANISPVKIGIQRVLWTFKHLKQLKNLALFLISFFFFIEGVNTVIYFVGNYAMTTMNFSKDELLYFFLITQITALLGAIGFGIIADSIGKKITLLITLVIWIMVISLVYISNSKFTFYLIGSIAGSVMGATQSVSRSLMSALVPEDKKTEFFGFYSFFGKSSAIIGPLTFGYISYITSSQRFAIISLLTFFIIGGIILLFVKEHNNISEESNLNI